MKFNKEKMINNFLSWKLPNDFSPDGIISVAPWNGDPLTYPTGTNLLNAKQASAMIDVIFEGAVEEQEEIAELKALVEKHLECYAYVADVEKDYREYGIGGGTYMGNAIAEANEKLVDSIEALTLSLKASDMKPKESL